MPLLHTHYTTATHVLHLCYVIATPLLHTCSIALVDPLLTDTARKNPKWISWKAHVRLLCFCLRYSYHATTAGDTLDGLISDYELKFDSAYGAGSAYSKPKHHTLRHLRKYLEAWGPFRQFWCMPFESFLLLLKRMLESTNWLTPAFDMANGWAQRRELLLAQDGGIAEYRFTASTLLLSGLALQEMEANSRIAAAVRQNEPHMTALRLLSSLERGSLQIAAGDWVLVSSPEHSLIGNIAQMALVLRSDGATLVRIWCTEVYSTAGVHEHADGMMRMAITNSPACMLVNFETSEVQLLSCTNVGAHLEFRYVF